MSNYETADRRPIADAFRWFAKAPVHWCMRWEIHPNTISYASIVASGVAATCFLLSFAHPALPILGIAWCILRLYLNMLDGMVAIASGKASATGEIANELPDRISDVLIFVGIAHGGLAIPILGYWAAIGSLLVAYVGTLGKAVGAHRDFSGPMSKPWRMVVLVTGIAVSAFQIPAPNTASAPIPILDAFVLIIVIGCLFTVLRRLSRIVADLNANCERNIESEVQ